MYIYGVVFFLSVVCLYFSEHISNKHISKILILVSVLIPAVLAGIRADDIGTDTLAYRTVYFEPIYKLSSLEEIFVWAFKQDFEIGFVLWNYIIARIFGKRKN